VVVIGRLGRPRRRSAAPPVFQIDAIPLIYSERFSAPGTSKYQIQKRITGLWSKPRQCWPRVCPPAGKAAIALFGCQSGAALATVVGVLVEVPVMLSVVRIVLWSRGWYQRRTLTREERAGVYE